MNTEELKATYRAKHIGEIVALWEGKERLTEEARTALTAVIEERGIDVGQILRDESLAAAQYEQREARRDEKKSRRYNLFAKVFLIATIPLAIIGLLLNPQPGKLLLVTISAATQGLVLALIVWGISMLKKKFRKYPTAQNAVLIHSSMTNALRYG